jgi:hypothetical protein
MSRPTITVSSIFTFCSADRFWRLRLRYCPVAWPTFQAFSSFRGFG